MLMMLLLLLVLLLLLLGQHGCTIKWLAAAAFHLSHTIT
jgi:hypothetical protein